MVERLKHSNLSIITRIFSRSLNPAIDGLLKAVMNVERLGMIERALSKPGPKGNRLGELSCVRSPVQ